jgi:hypothetical protein
MTKVAKPTRFPLGNVLIALLIAVCLLQAQASAQTKGAVSLLRQYQEELAKVYDVAEGTLNRRGSFSFEGYECNPSMKTFYEDQFNLLKAELSPLSHDISQATQNLETSSRAAERAVAELLAFVINNQTDIKSVSDMVDAAKADQLGGFLQRLHLGAAKNRLAMLITEVR